jgi:hydrogenase nickel incorporation protein HypB
MLMCSESTTVVKIQKKALSANDLVAEKLRQRFIEQGTLVVNLISSPGSGKTTWLEYTLKKLKDQLNISVLVGDLATERDAMRLRDTGVASHQIVTGGACHLDARMVEEGLGHLDTSHTDILFIENVGNLVCPTSYDLGEDFKIALLSITEGEDKPFKYPGIFTAAQITLITKTDLLPHINFDIETASRQINTLNPQARVILCSAADGTGWDEWQQYLLDRLSTRKKTSTSPGSP